MYPTIRLTSTFAGFLLIVSSLNFGAWGQTKPAEQQSDSRPISRVVRTPSAIHRPLATATINVPFLPPLNYDVSGEAQSVVVADLNGDGFADLVVGTSDGVNVLLGSGDGSFPSSVALDTGGIFTHVAVADVNGDGKLDLVAADECGHFDGSCSTALVGVLLGNGNGSFQPVVTYEAGGSSARSIAVADFNHDGKLDLVVALCATVTSPCSRGGVPGSLVAVLLGNGDGSFRAAVAYPSGGYEAISVVVSDVNRDGKPDILVANVCAAACLFNGEGNVGVLLGKGDGTFRAVTTYDPGGSDAFSLAAADLNQDGKIDLLVANCVAGWDGGCATAQTSVFLGNGDGTFQGPTAYSLAGDFSYAIAVEDLNGDGKLDVGAVTLSSFVSLLFGHGDGTFQPVVVVDEGGGDPRSLTIADVNGDGRLDLVAGNFGSSSVGVLLNNSGPHAPTTTAVVSSINPVLIGKVVTYTATVTTASGRPALRSVLFKDGATTVATVTLTTNQAVFSTKYTKIGSHTITAVYTGDSENASSTSAALTQFVQGATTTTLATSLSPSHVTQPVTFTATVASRYGTVLDGDRVAFYDGKKLLGSQGLVGGVARFTTSSLPAGVHTINATYAGDPIFKSSTAALKQEVEGFSTATALTSTPNPSTVGQTITFTARITTTGPTVPTGRVRFLDGTVVIGSATLINGITNLKRSTLPSGTRSITAQYLGDTSNAASTSSVLLQHVNP